MAKAALIVDLDGTLWDSFPLYSSVLKEHWGLPKASTLEQLAGGQSVLRIAQNAGITRNRLVAAIATAGPVQLFEGVRDTLKLLHERGRPMAVVTSLSGRLAVPMLSGSMLHEFFEVVVHAGNCRRRKPSAGPILAAIERLGLEPHSGSVYVGDRHEDAVAAQAAGVGFAWASYGYGVGCPAGTDVVLERFAQIADL